MTSALEPVTTFHVGAPMRQCRVVPFALPDEPAVLFVHAACAEDDPYHRMFFLPDDTLKLTAFTLSGDLLWHRDLGPGVVPGMWFCPVLPFDLDRDDVDEVWVVGNTDPEHALNQDAYALERRDGRSGDLLNTRPWPQVPPQATSHFFRNFLNAGFSRGQPRLITAQGTYGRMALQCWDGAMRPLWERVIAAEEPGARGSHMFPVLDIDGDGRDELLWGERCIDIDTGQDLWVGDRDTWRGHSDVIQPTRDAASGRWSVYTCREAGRPHGAVVMFDDRGREVWSHRGIGHMDNGWTARLADDRSHWCYALEIGHKTAGREGFRRTGMQESLYDLSGRPIESPMPLYQSAPVDFNGDGWHELTYRDGERAGLVVDRHGRTLGRLEGRSVLVGKLRDDLPGEQILTWSEDGTARLYACPHAADSDFARRRWAHPFHAACLRVQAMGYHPSMLGGL